MSESMSEAAPESSALVALSAPLRWAWVGVLALAVISRMVALPTTPLAPVEALRAVASLHAVEGQGWSGAATDARVIESPLLLVGNAVLFAVFGAGDGLARFLPALAGIGLVAFPLLWRRQLGGIGALVAAGVVLVSPLALFAARRVDGATVGILGAALVVTVLIRSVLEDPAPSPRQALMMSGDECFLALGIALGLLGGPAFYDLLLPGLIVWFVLRRSRAGSVAALRWRRSLLVSIGAAWLISIGFGLHWSGWSGLAEGAAAWLAGWQRQAGSGSGPFLLLALYEPFLLIVVGAGLVFLLLAVKERRSSWLQSTPLIWLLWGTGALVLSLLRPGSTTASVSAVVVPLALLAGFGLAQVVSDVPTSSARWVTLHALVALIFWLPAFIVMAQHAVGLAYVDRPGLLFLGIVVLLALQAMVTFLFLFPLAADHVWRGALLGFAAMFFLVQISFGIGVAFARSDSAIEPAIGTATSRDVRHLRDKLHDIAVLRGVRRDALEVVVVVEDDELAALLSWYLRDFTRFSLSASWPMEAAALVITPESLDVSPFEGEERWRGMCFVAATTYHAPIPGCQQWMPPVCRDAVKWYLYRESPYPSSAQNVVLWQATDQPAW
ncbi:MAG: hypothetical protein ACP5HG_05855 [Anaerolineae bacterium]